MARRPQPLRIAIDTGGTFTDCVWFDPATGQLQMLKVFSTPADPSQAICQALNGIAHSGELVILHGTTVGTNTLLERKGARTALVTTAGFEDVIEIGRQARPKLYDFFFDRVQPLVEQELRFGIEERTASDGQILSALGKAQLESLRSQLAAKKPESIAISFLFSFANPKNERTIAQALKQLGVPLSISHEILPEFREYERTSTVVMNAYLQPVMQSYLENLKKRARELSLQRESNPDPGRTARCGTVSCGTEDRRFSTVEDRRFSTVEERRFSAAESARMKRALAPAFPRIFVMQSSGGITSLASAAREPVRTVLSGPAGGVVGAAAAGRSSGFERIIAFDMGGTSTDVSLVEGELTTASQAEVAGLPLGVPLLDIHTVGAGGGSLARFDAGGVLRVGPESAGADPGPICYGRGTQPTVTDANLLLGRLQPTRFLGGDFTLDLDRTRRITSEWLKRRGSRLTLEKFAEGMIRVANATMEKAIRVVSIERGRDPRDFALVAFGGAGGLHACALAEALSIPHVIVPAFPGALSALGILASDVIKDYSRTILVSNAKKAPLELLEREFAKLEKQAVRDFHQEAWPGKVRCKSSIDLRYRGQGYELNIPFTRNLLTDFHQEHLRRYGYANPAREVEIVTLRLRALIRSAPSHVRTVAQTFPGRSRRDRLGRARFVPPSPSMAKVLFNVTKVSTSIHSRDALQPGKKYRGPAVVTEYSATTVVPPGKHFQVDAAGNLLITLR
jgi:N-methylhydantoinase A